jgi:hypothetical protein
MSGEDATQELNRVRSAFGDFQKWAILRDNWERDVLNGKQDHFPQELIFESNRLLTSLWQQLEPLSAWAERFHIDAEPLRTFCFERSLPADASQRRKIKAVLNKLEGKFLALQQRELVIPQAAPLAAVKSAAVAAKAPARSLTKKAKALAALVDHPGWTDEQIAAAAGCHVKSLYRWEDFKRARAAMRSGRDAIPTGTKNDGTGDVEAWDDDE